eukprot:120861-Lingulodinium_polyedra.AAC.1
MAAGARWPPWARPDLPRLSRVLAEVTAPPRAGKQPAGHATAISDGQHAAEDTAARAPGSQPNRIFLDQ